MYKSETTVSLDKKIYIWILLIAPISRIYNLSVIIKNKVTHQEPCCQHLTCNSKHVYRITRSVTSLNHGSMPHLYEGERK